MDKKGWGDDRGEDREDVHWLWWMNTAWGIKEDSALFLNWHSKHWLEINAVKKCSFWQIQLRNALLTNITNNSCGNTLFHQSSAASSLSQLLHLFSFPCQSASLIQVFVVAPFFYLHLVEARHITEHYCQLHPFHLSSEKSLILWSNQEKKNMM